MHSLSALSLEVAACTNTAKVDVDRLDCIWVGRRPLASCVHDKITTNTRCEGQLTASKRIS